MSLFCSLMTTLQSYFHIDVTKAFIALEDFIEVSRYNASVARIFLATVPWRFCSFRKYFFDL